jgi:hypothetical protein
MYSIGIASHSHVTMLGVRAVGSTKLGVKGMPQTEMRRFVWSESSARPRN